MHCMRVLRVKIQCITDDDRYNDDVFLLSGD